jgi:hypothetical protein
LKFHGKVVELRPAWKHIAYCDRCNQERIANILKEDSQLFEYFLKVKRRRLKVDWKKYFNSPLYRSVLRSNGEGAWDTYYRLTDFLKAIGIVSPLIEGNYSFDNSSYYFHSYGGEELYFVDLKDAIEYLIFLGTESPVKKPPKVDIRYVSKVVTAAQIMEYYQNMNKE